MALTAMEIYKNLEKSNCKECGFPTCMAFAMQVAAKQKALTDCPRLSDEAKEKFSEAASHLGRLEDVLQFGHALRQVEYPLRGFLDLREPCRDILHCGRRVGKPVHDSFVGCLERDLDLLREGANLLLDETLSIGKGFLDLVTETVHLLMEKTELATAALPPRSECYRDRDHRACDSDRYCYIVHMPDSRNRL